MIDTINKIVRTSRQMLHEIGREPTPEELAEKLGMPLEKVRKDAQDRQGADLAGDPDRRRGGFPSRRLHRGQEHHPADRCRDPVEPARTTTRVLASLTPREERIVRMRFGIGMNTDHTLEEGRPAVLGDPRAHPPDRGEGAAEAEAPEPVEDSKNLPRQLMRRAPRAGHHFPGRVAPPGAF
jgi:DNA-directed RNA polymerase, sigma subunit (sigma70/sigma32)